MHNTWLHIKKSKIFIKIFIKIFTLYHNASISLKSISNAEELDISAQLALELNFGENYTL